MLLICFYYKKQSLDNIVFLFFTQIRFWSIQLGMLWVYVFCFLNKKHAYKIVIAISNSYP